ncbi:prolipoprotein diacylglyceryl transferase [Candidatus Woesearchaeota archaeon]|nr:prolipoprotein diacylglyceryl transferase [Candidatus Woesearchaeota archaeon]
MDPVLLNVFGLEIRWYGLLMVIAFICGYYILLKIRDDVSKELIEEYVFYMILGLIIGARVGEVLFYEPTYYFSNPIKIFYIWEGGLASHGALIGGIIANYLFCKKYKFSFYKMADKAVIPIAIGAVFVRIGNFINNEIIGRISDFIFSIDINGEKRHPSQLYESLKNLLIFGILLFLNKKKRRDGFIFWMFILLFGIFRFIVEFWKEGGLYFGLTNGQWLSIPVTLIGLFFMRKIYK